MEGPPCPGIHPVLSRLFIYTSLAYSALMRFVETPVFTRRITDLLSDDAYTRLQRDLLRNPRAGKVIQGTGGLRKLRWGDESKQRGKRGGLRIIYYWYFSEEVFYMLLAFSKNDQEDLTPDQKRALRRLVEQEFK